MEQLVRSSSHDSQKSMNNVRTLSQDSRRSGSGLEGSNDNKKAKAVEVGDVGVNQLNQNLFFDHKLRERALMFNTE